MSNELDWFAKGVELHRAGRIEEAAEIYRQVIARNPQQAEALCNLGAALASLSRFDEAIAAYQRSIELCPNIAATHNNLGNAWKASGNLAAAADEYQRAIALQADYAEPIYNLANLLLEDRQLEAAVQLYQRAIALQPIAADAYNNLGNALRQMGRVEEAINAYRQAALQRPDLAQAHHNLGVLLQSQGDLEAAAACYQRALELNPNSGRAITSLLYASLSICDWHRLSELSERAIRSVTGEPIGERGEPADPLSMSALTNAASPALLFQCAEQYASHLERLVEPAARCSPRAVLKHGGARLRVGYLSADFREHAVANSVVELLESHDRESFEIFGYSFGPDDQSPVRHRIVNACEHFREHRGASNAMIAQQIARDQIDILIDLQGHTGDARAEILAMRPAPIQINFLGFPGTLGGRLADYILVDDYVVPMHQQPYFSERIIHLPGCFMVHDGRCTASSRIPSRTECGLPEHAFVFGGFCSSFKLTPDMFYLWMRLLKAVPDSLLWLLDAHPAAKANLCREAELNGVRAQRLIFAEKVRLRELHLARQRNIDLFLDTYPYNLHSTAGDVLWLGIPLISMSGPTFASRVAGSLLRAVELPQLIVDSLQDYERLALRLALDQPERMRIRRALAENQHMLARYSGRPFAKNLERVLRSLAKDHL